MSQDCPICYEPLDKDTCLVDCSAMHLFHHACISQSISKYKNQCPLDRQIITNCLHDGQLKKLPSPPSFVETVMEIQANMNIQDSPCYICHVATRDGLDEDEVVICSGCDVIYCHAECEAHTTGRRFNYYVHWYCPVCRRERARPRTRNNI